MLWFKEYTVEALQEYSKNTILEHLGIELTKIGEDYLEGRMPVNEKTHRPGGILHGGASVVLAESLGSLAAWMCVDPEKYDTVGMEVNANHVRSVHNGCVYGKTTPLHIGRRTHIWEMILTNEQGKLVCISRITMAVVPKADIAQ